MIHIQGVSSLMDIHIGTLQKGKYRVFPRFNGQNKTFNRDLKNHSVFLSPIEFEKHPVYV